MRRSILTAGLVVMVISLFLAGCAKQAITTPTATSTTTSTATATQPVKAIKWIATSHNNLLTNSSDAITMCNVAEKIKRLTNGRFTFDLYWSESFAPSAQSLNVLGSGLCGAAFVNLGLFPGQLPLSQSMALPMLGPRRVDQFTMAWDNASLKSPDMLAEFTKNNVVYGFCPIGSIKDVISRSTPITSVDDFKGKKMRCASASMGEIFKQFGAAITVIASSDIYNAFQSGLIDCSDGGAGWMITQKLAEVTKYFITDIRFAAGVSYWLFSKTAYDELPADLKDVLNSVRLDTEKWHTYWYEDTVEYGGDPKNCAGYQDVMNKYNVQTIHFPAAERAKLVDKAAPIWADWVSKNGGDKAQQWLNLVRSECDSVVAKYPNGLGTPEFIVWPPAWPNYVDLGYYK